MRVENIYGGDEFVGEGGITHWTADADATTGYVGDFYDWNHPDADDKTVRVIVRYVDGGREARYFDPGHGLLIARDGEPCQCIGHCVIEHCHFCRANGPEACGFETAEVAE